MKMPELILASASPRRIELLSLLGLPFEVIPGDVEELSAWAITPVEACQVNAYRKARNVAKKHPDALVIGADTEVCLGKRTFGKPANRREAENMLVELAGQTHQVITGVCLLHLRHHRQSVFACATDVTFHSLSRKQVRDYLRRIDPMDKAGAYAIQEHGHAIVEAIHGSFSNVVGLPVEALRIELAEWLTPSRAG